MTDPDVYLEDSTTFSVSDYQILVPDYFNGGWITLGSGVYCSAKLEGLGTPELRANEYNIIGSDGASFGREYYNARKWTIQGAIKTGAIQNAPGEPEDAWSSLSQLMRVWDQYPGRQTARSVVPLYWKRPGRETMLMYGRPERIDPDVTLAYSGYIKYTALFRQSDPKFYSAEELTQTVQVVSPSSGGLVLAADQRGLYAVDGYLQTSAPVTTLSTIVIDGEVETSPVIIFKGPVRNPKLTFYDDFGAELWSVQVTVTIEQDENVTVDTRLFMRTARASDGTNVAGFLRSPAMRDITMPVGEYQIAYTGQDTTTASTVEIRYRNAWTTV